MRRFFLKIHKVRIEAVWGCAEGALCSYGVNQREKLVVVYRHFASGVASDSRFFTGYTRKWVSEKARLACLGVLETGGISLFPNKYWRLFA